MVEVTGVLAAIGGIVAILVIALVIYGKGKRAGEDAVTTKVNAATAETAARMAEAGAAAPRGKAAIVDKLGKGEI